MDSDNADIKPILSYPPNIINGIIPITIKNIDHILPSINPSNCIYQLCYQFILNQPEVHYQNETWKSKSIDDISYENILSVKVPLFLLPYTLEFNVKIIEIPIKGTKSKIISPSELTSITHSIQIPSMLIEPYFAIDNKVQYQPENASFMRSGKILKLLANDMIQIKTYGIYPELQYQPVIVTQHKSAVYHQCVAHESTINITNTLQARSDLVLKTMNTEQIDIYTQLCDDLCGIYELLRIQRKIDYNHYFGITRDIAKSVALEIWKLLFEPQFYHRVQCIYDGYDLFDSEQWAFEVNKTISDHLDGIDCRDLQNSWDAFGYSCDICRIDVTFFDYMWHCKNGDHRHDFCLDCIHSIIKQYDQMQEFLCGILKSELNKDCIEQIVIYCVGRVIKFDC